MYSELKKWSNKHYSHLPWRVNRSVYNTLVSEIMLQQTTVSTVLSHFERFISKYPNIRTLARASEEEMLIDWKGLGYYRRARNLLNAAKEIQEKFGGVIPLDFDELISIKGIGSYTANAIISIGADRKAISLDANLERVISRLYGIETEKGPKLIKDLYLLFSEDKICQEILTIGPRVYNESLMDLGRSICKARSASCSICPLKNSCVAFKLNKTDQIPVQIKKDDGSKTNIELRLLRVIVKQSGKILAYKKEKTQWLSGQYEIPTFILYSNDKDLSQYPKIEFDESIYNLPSFKTAITKYKITNFVLWANEDELKELSDEKFEWIDAENKNFSTSTYKAFKV